MSPKPLPPLQVGQTYQVQDFEYFEFARGDLVGGKPILRLHLANKTILELPTSDGRLRDLLKVLCAAFPDDALKTLRAVRPAAFR